MAGKSPIILVMLAIITMTAIITCSSNTRNLKAVKIDIQTSTNAPSQIDEAYLNDIELFRQEVDAQFDKNDSLMLRHKERLKEEYKETNPYYKNEIVKLEEQHLNLKKRLDNYETTERANWYIFKEQFRTEMFDLNSSYEELRVKPANHLPFKIINNTNE